MYKLEIFKKLSRDKDAFWKEEYKRIRDNFILPIILSIVSGGIVGLVSYDTSQTLRNNLYGITLALLSGSIGGFVCFAFLEWRNGVIGRKSELAFIEESSKRILLELEKIKPCWPIIRHYRKLSGKYTDILEIILEKSIEDSGGIIISAGSREYKDFLSKFLSLSNECYFATLRGGQNKPKFRLNWFFEGDAILDPHGLSIPEKIEYLKDVNLSSIKRKIRILFFNETDKEFLDFQNEKRRNDFFDLNSKVSIYLASPEVIIAQLQNKNIVSSKADFVYEDYAIFDKEIVLKHNGTTSYIATKDQIESYMAVFELLDLMPGIFKELTKELIGTEKWVNYIWKTAT